MGKKTNLQRYLLEKGLGCCDEIVKVGLIGFLKEKTKGYEKVDGMRFERDLVHQELWVSDGTSCPRRKSLAVIMHFL